MMGTARKFREGKRLCPDCFELLSYYHMGGPCYECREGDGGCGKTWADVEAVFLEDVPCGCLAVSEGEILSCGE